MQYNEVGDDNRIRWYNSRKAFSKDRGVWPDCGHCRKWWKKSNNSKRKTLRTHRKGK